jgi:intein/homing endonuclease
MNTQLIEELNLPETVPLFSGYNDVYYWNRDCEADVIINQGGTSCFAPDTLVQTLDGAKPIRDIAIGDLVKTYDELADLIVYKPVVDKFTFDNNKRTVEVVMKSGAIIRCTEDHKFYHEGEWVQIKDILCKI